MRFPNIQLLRLVAAVGVVLFHLGDRAPALVGVEAPVLRFAWVGGYAVPLFFAVSGFVLTGAARAAPVGPFLVARFLRLYPGYWLALGGAALLMRLRLFTEYDRWLLQFVGPTQVALWPAGPGAGPYLLGGIEWSLIFEVFLSVGLAALVAVGGVRRLPGLAAGWVALIVARVVVRPGFAFEPFPHWATVAASAYVVPFLLGVLTYSVRDRGRRWRWAVLPAAVGVYYANPLYVTDPEWHWVVWGGWSAAVVWLAVQFPQLSDRNPLARLGDYTYGLFLFHVPLIALVCHAAARQGWTGRGEVVWAAGAVAVAGGLLFGRVECALHARLRPLAKARVGRWVSAAWRPRPAAGRPSP